MKYLLTILALLVLQPIYADPGEATCYIKFDHGSVSDQGTGVAYCKDDTNVLVVTVAHGVRDHNPQSVYSLSFTHGVYGGRLVQRSSDQDLAIIMLTPKDPASFPTVDVADYPLPIGSKVYSIQHPMGDFTQTLQSGYTTTLTETNFGTKQGGSGSGIFDSNDLLVGIIWGSDFHSYSAFTPSTTVHTYLTSQRQWCAGGRCYPMPQYNYRYKAKQKFDYQPAPVKLLPLPDSNFKRLQGDVDGLKTKMDIIQNTNDEILVKLNGLPTVDALKGVESKVQGVESKVQGVESKIVPSDELQQRLEASDKRIDGIANTVKTVSAFGNYFLPGVGSIAALGAGLGAFVGKRIGRRRIIRQAGKTSKEDH